MPDQGGDLAADAARATDHSPADRRPLVVYGVALATLAVALMLGEVLAPYLGATLPLVTLFGAVAAAVWLGGARPGVLVALLGYLASNFWFIEPYGVFKFGDPRVLVGLLAYLFTCALVIGFGEAFRRAATALRESQERFRVMADAAPVLIWLGGTDMRCTWFNRTWLEFVGRTLRQEVGDGWTENVHPGDRERCLRTYTAAFEARRPFEMEYRLRRHDGEYRWVLDKGVPRYGARGRFTGYIGSCIDISERKASEDWVRISEERFARFMQHLPGLAWIKDLEGRYVFVNEAAERAFRMPRQRIYGRTDEEIFPPHTAAQFKVNDRRAMQTPAGIQVVETLRQDDGLVHHSLVNKFLIPGPGGQAGMLGGMAIDVTDRMRAEAALKEADRRKDQFVAALAHELRNPLAPIRNAIEVLQRKGRAVPELQWCRDVIDRQVRHMARLLDDLLDVARITHDKLELRRQRIALADVIRDAAETSRPIIDADRHELVLVPPSEPVHLQADRVRLAQVFSNLLNNAARYSEPGRRIEVTCRKDGRAIVVSVQDEGAGISADLRPRLFEMFSQSHEESDRARGGLGIGLWLVKRLVELHGGSIEVRSDGPGKGSRFDVRLPVAAEAAEAPARAGADRRPGAVTDCRILIVDDFQDSADSLALLMRPMVREVRTAYDGEAALAMAEKFRPDVILLDIGMPRMSGYDVCRQIRRQPWGKGMVVVALTGWGQEEDRRRTEEAGFSGHLVKPVDPAVLVDLLGRCDPGRVPRDGEAQRPGRSGRNDSLRGLPR